MRSPCDDSNQRYLPTASRRDVLKGGAALVAASALDGVIPTAQVTRAEWPQYGGDKASSKYSPLAQIDKDKFGHLSIAWKWRSAEEETVTANRLKTWHGNAHR